MTKAAVAKGKAVRVRAAKAALESLAPGVGAAVSAEAPATPQESPYGVYVDAQGVPYLRAELTAKGGRYLINTGAGVEVVELDAETVNGRGLELIPEASVAESARILLFPLTEGVTISERAKQYLQKIIADPVTVAAEKEEMEMAKSKAAKKSTAKKSATNGAARGRKSAFEPTGKIKVLVAENPKRKESASFKRFGLYSKHSTVADFLKAGGTGADLSYDVAHKYVEVK